MATGALEFSLIESSSNNTCSRRHVKDKEKNVRNLVKVMTGLYYKDYDWARQFGLFFTLWYI